VDADTPESLDDMLSVRMSSCNRCRDVFIEYLHVFVGFQGAI
jgi:hypothetical protein